MMWQDLVIGVGQLAFALALVPSLNTKEKPHRATCLMTAAVLFTFSITYATLDMWYSTISVTLCGVLWTVLLFQERLLSENP